MRIEATNWPLGPTLADRSIRVVIEPRNWRSARAVLRVSGQIEIAEGAARGQTIVPIPQSEAWREVKVSVYENGELLDDVSDSATASSILTHSSEAIPSILIVDADAPTRNAREQMVRQPPPGVASAGKTEPVGRLPDVRSLVTLFPRPDQVGYGSTPSPTPSVGPVDDPGILRLLLELPRVEMLPPQELPTRWLDLSCFDLVFISRADLEGLAANQPPAWQALRDWVASGPTLCVYDLELSDERLAGLEALLGMTSVSDATTDGVAQGRWRTANPSGITEDIPALHPRGTSMSMEDTSASPQPPAPASAPARKPKPFVYRPFYRGRVVAMQTGEPLAAQASEAAWLFNELGSHTWMWYQRHGMSLHRENSDYWNWLVPGIGRAPVGSFLILITAFVIVIGPVNYFLLRRKRRLYLLLVTVPLGAALVTLALFAYALISDGLGVRVRMRSFTEIDQRAGRSVSWSRQSYYAGLAPSGGLTFPETVAVFPIEQYPAERQQGASGMQWLVWGEQQNLASGYISSRSAAQFLVVESGPSSRGLLVESGPGDAAVWVTNRLDATVDRLVVKDERGRILGTTQLDPGQRRRLDAIDPASARRELRQALGSNAPAYPSGYNSNFSGALGWNGGYSRFWSNVDNELPTPTLATGILERSLQATLNADVQTWQPRTYVALTRTSPGVSIGYGRAREEASFHVVLGTW